MGGAAAWEDHRAKEPSKHEETAGQTEKRSGRDKVEVTEKGWRLLCFDLKYSSWQNT